VNPEKELIDQWLAALRSGDYNQGYGCLRHYDYDNPQDSTYCCLGVLCDIVDNTKWNASGPYQQDHNYVPPKFILDQLPTLFPDFRKISDRTMRHPQQYDDHFLDQLVTTNDQGDSFEKIADLIERQFAHNLKLRENSTND